MKKLKKGGSIDRDSHNMILACLNNGGQAALPIDNVYGIISIDNNQGRSKLIKISGEDESFIIQLISSFKMLEEIALIDKLKFDFLHRIWPGEVIVKLNRKRISGNVKSILVLSPRHKYIKDIIDAAEKPLIFIKGFENGKFFKNKDKKLMSKYLENTGLVVIIDELSKDHPSPTIVDLTGEDLAIIHEGKVSSDEIKSLYFLDKM